jgi:hypothetical protein
MKDESELIFLDLRVRNFDSGAASSFILPPSSFPHPSSLIPHLSDYRHQPADFPLNILLASIREKQIGATHRTEWRDVDPFRIDSR